MKQALEIVRGTTNAFSLALTDANGTAYTLETGQVLVFGLKDEKTDEKRVLVKQITRAANGEYYLELSAADTADLEPGRYFYDIGLQHGTEIFYNVIKANPFTILPNITRLGDGA